MRTRKVIAMLILITSAGLTGLTIQNSKKTPITFGLNNFDNTALTEQITDFLRLRNQFNQGNNLSELLADYFSQEIQSANPDLINSKDFSTLKSPDGKIIAQWVDKNISKLTIEELKPEILDRSLIITSEQNETTIINYFKKLNEIAGRNFNNPPGKDFNAQNATISDFIETLEKLILRYEQTLNELYGLTAPLNLLAIHKEEIKLTAAQQQLIKIIANFHQDPLKALMAISLSKQITLDFKKLKQDALIFLKQNNIAIPEK